MPWLSRFFSPTDKLHADDLNNLHHDQIRWGGDVDGGGYVLSNVTIVQAKQAAGTGGVSSWNTRTGAVMPQIGDYTADQVGAVPTSRKIITALGSGLVGGGPLTGDLTLTADVLTVFGRKGNVALLSSDLTNAGGVPNTLRINTVAGSGLTGGGPLSGDLNLSVVPDSTNQQIQCMSQGSPIGSPRPKINFVSGTGALVTVQEISASNRIDVTVASTGTGGGMVDPTQLPGDLIVRGQTAPANRFPVGTDGQVLTADHLQAQGVKWATPSSVGQVTSVFGRAGVVVQVSGDYTAAQITNAVDQTGSYFNPPWIKSIPWGIITNPPAFMLDPTLAKGDMIVHGTTTTRLTVGADGGVLTADSSVPLGVRWIAAPVTSVFGRFGAITAGPNDYTVDKIAGAVPTSIVLNAGLGLTGGGNLSQNRSFDVVPNTTNQQVQLMLAGTKVGQPRHAINFINGAGVVMTITDRPSPDDWIDVTVSSSGSGGGGGMVDPTSHVGDLIVRGPANVCEALPVGTDGQVLTADHTVRLGVTWKTPAAGAAGSQSPWVTDIDAAGNQLNNVKGIGVNIAANPALARVYALTNTTEDAFRAVNNSVAGVASASCFNDVGDSVSLRSYCSGFVGPLAGLTSLEATKSLALLANSAEVMRLHLGHVLIGTTTDDGSDTLQVNGKIKSLSGGYVFPDGTIQTTAYTAGSSPVTSVFTRTGAVVAQAHDYNASQVDNAVDSTVLYNNPAFINTLDWGKIANKPSAAIYQSPWLQDIDGATFKLKNAGTIGIGNDATGLAFSGYPQLMVGPTTATGTCGLIMACGNSSTPPAAVGAFCGVNWAITASDKRIGHIQFNTDGAVNSGAIAFYTYNAGSPLERVRITAAGLVGIGTATPQSILHCYRKTDGGITAIGVDNDSGTVPLGAAFQFRYGSIGATGGIYHDTPAGTQWFMRLKCWNQSAEVERFTINGATGAVGIGTTAPQCKLDFGTSAPNAKIVVGTYMSGDAWTGIGMDPVSVGVRIAGNMMGGSDSLMEVGYYSNDSAHNWTSRMKVLSNGLVGIGTVNPSVRLSVVNPTLGGPVLGSASGGFGVLGDTANWGLYFGAYVTGTSWMQVQRTDGNGAVYSLVLQPMGGAVGIGTSAPNALLEIAGYGAGAWGNLVLRDLSNSSASSGTTSSLTGMTSDGVRSFFIGNASGAYGQSLLFWNDRGAPILFGTSGSERMRISEAAPYVSIGTSTTTDPLTINGIGNGGQLRMVYGNYGCIMRNDGANWYFMVTNSGDPYGGWKGPFPIQIELATCKVTMGNSLNVGGTINCTGYQLNGAAFTGSGVGVQINSGPPQGVFGYLNFYQMTGIAITAGTVSGNTYTIQIGQASDARLKRNVEPLTGGLAEILQLRPITGEWNGLGSTREGLALTSVIAQDVQKFMPGAVYPYRTKLREEDEEPTELLGIDQMALTCHLILAVQQLERRLKELEQKVN